MDDKRKQNEMPLKTNSKIVDINFILSVSTLNTNGGNILIKRQKLAKWMRKM